MKLSLLILQTSIALMMTPLCQAQILPHEESNLFAGSGVCGDCHMPGGMNPTALLDSDYNDVSPPLQWRSTMMANAARDPFWQAKVQAEITAHPHLQSVIEDKCTTCHAPVGRVEALYNGTESYTLEAMRADPLAMDGVSCAACHQIQDIQMGAAESFSGHFQITDERTIYGPYEYPISGPMNTSVNYDVQYGEHMDQSELCATCHTLFTPFVDDEGIVVGEAPEQVPYLEWLNSDFPSQGIECQTCHMPALEETVVISNRPSWLNGRNPLHVHEFVGGNVFMLKLLRDFGDELDVTASTEQFDASIARTMKMLTEQSVDLELSANWLNEDMLDVQVDVQNLSGHKFPTAYPSRRAWIELQVIDGLNQIIFHSGSWNNSGEVTGIDSSYEPHHQLITSSDQVQVYQNIPMDVNGEKTYTLLRISDYLKDNRIPPLGYSSNGIAVDSTRVIGLASLDPDFNREGADEGTGADIIHYQITGLDPGAEYQLTANMNYQTLAPRFADDLFSYDVSEVVEFQSYYQQMDLTPIQLNSVTMTMNSLGTEPYQEQKPNSMLMVESYPNPFNPDVQILISMATPGYINFSIYDIQGRIVQEMSARYFQAGEHSFVWDAKNLNGELVQSGVYILRVTQKGMSSRSIVQAQHKLVYLK